MSTNEEIQLFQQISHSINERLNLTEEQLKRYETWKIQPGMAQIKLEYIDFDHEVRLSIEHLSEKDKQTVTEEKTETNEPKKKKFKGQNRKHLELNARSSSSANANDHHLCFFVIRGGLQNCPYQTNCKHSHDLSTYLPHRPVDISPDCYMFKTYGQCFYGILCRSGQSHIDPITGHNIINVELNNKYIESLNKYPPLLKHLLRRKKYDYTLSDRLIKIANKQITKANVAKRNNPDEKHDDKDIGEKEDRSLVDIYYSNLQTNQQNQEEVR